MDTTLNVQTQRSIWNTKYRILNNRPTEYTEKIFNNNKNTLYKQNKPKTV